jgi:hypothetical protein
LRRAASRDDDGLRRRHHIHYCYHFAVIYFTVG